jgi:hypothetical protein
LWFALPKLGDLQDSFAIFLRQTFATRAEQVEKLKKEGKKEEGDRPC